MKMRLELVPLPVADVDRAKRFYAERLGFHADFDVQPSEQMRVVQLTPPGSACSITVGTGIVQTTPGSVQGLHLVVDDIHAARDMLRAAGVDVGEVVVMGAPGQPTVSYAAFNDPDGNGWTFQEIRPNE